VSITEDFQIYIKGWIKGKHTRDMLFQNLIYLIFLVLFYA